MRPRRKPLVDSIATPGAKSVPSSRYAAYRQRNTEDTMASARKLDELWVEARKVRPIGRPSG